MFEFKFEAMGTVLEIRVLDTVSKILEEKIKSEIFDYTVWYDETFSRFKENSLVTKLSTQTGIFSVPIELVEMLQIYFKLEAITEGRMNPLIGNTLSDLGYDDKYTLQKKDIVRETPKLSTAVKIISPDKIELSEKVLIDLGALGKGYWVDKVREILERNKISNYLVNGSGDIYYSSPSQAGGVKVQLEGTDGAMLGEVEINNESICGSGTGRRNWSINESENLHHIVDAMTSKSTENILNVWVKVPTHPRSTTYCDALATAIFFVEPEELQEKFKKEFGVGFEYSIIYSDGKMVFSRNFGINNSV